jgi:hypothetical protein
MIPPTSFPSYYSYIHNYPVAYHSVLEGQKGNINKINISNNGKKVKIKMNLLFFSDCWPKPIILYLKHFVKDFPFQS